jgi:hypothetical protein
VLDEVDVPVGPEVVDTGCPPGSDVDTEGDPELCVDTDADTDGAAFTVTLVPPEVPPEGDVRPTLAETVGAGLAVTVADAWTGAVAVVVESAPDVGFASSVTEVWPTVAETVGVVWVETETEVCPAGSESDVPSRSAA